MSDYKSVGVRVMICATLVNTQTHTETRRQTALYRLCTTSCWAKKNYKKRITFAKK